MGVRHKMILRWLAGGLAVCILTVTVSHGAKRTQARAPDTTALFDETVWNDFGLIAVQADGRIKPLETFATQILIQFSGRGRYGGRSAVQWLADLLFVPERTADDKVFLINDPAVAVSLGLSPEPKRRYAFQQLHNHYADVVRLAQQAAGIDEKQRDHAEREILRLHRALTVYSGLSKAFSFARPHPHFAVADPDLKRELALNGETGSAAYIDIALRARQLLSLSDELMRKPPDAWSPKEQRIAALMRHLKEWPAFYQDIPLKIIPPGLLSQGRDETIWIHPWEGTPDLFQTQVGREALTALTAMQRAYEAKDEQTFHQAVNRFRKIVYDRAAQNERRAMDTFIWERRLNRIRPFLWAMLLYLLASTAVWLGMKRNAPLWFNLGWVFTLCGLALQTGGLLIRIFILQRPPVSTLYETFLFVSLVIAVIGVGATRFLKNTAALAAAVASAAVLLLISTRFAASGDTLKVLTAVLNSNFWLMTHVLTITTGYAGVIFAGVVAHLMLVQRATRPQERCAVLEKLLWGGLAFGLFFTFVGTNLGGVWADQSWGRFWGWDPKENGALMIILWVAAMFHGRWAKMIGSTACAVMGVAALMIVVWAWFGINLLSVGLHSYGFTSGLQQGLAVYYGSEVLFLTIIYIKIKYEAKHTVNTAEGTRS